MKDLKLNKEVANRLQDEEMANLIGASGVDVTNTKSGKAVEQDQQSLEQEGGSSSCCQKSCK